MAPFNPFVTDEFACAESAKGERFAREADEWIEANPQAWQYMVDSARMAAILGERFGIASLCEHVRWSMRAQGTTGFKLNNNHRAAFARRLLREVPECEGLLSVRNSVIDLND